MHANVAVYETVLETHQKPLNVVLLPVNSGYEISHNIQTTNVDALSVQITPTSSPSSSILSTSRAR